MSTQINNYGSIGNVAETVVNQEATLYISEQRKDINEVVAEVNSLLSYVEEMNPTVYEMQVETQKAIEHNSTLKVKWTPELGQLERVIKL